MINYRHARLFIREDLFADMVDEDMGQPHLARDKQRRSHTEAECRGLLLPLR